MYKRRKFMRRGAAYLAAACMSVSMMPALACASGTSEYDTSDAVYFSFTDSGITTTDSSHASDYKISDTELSIKAAGTYVVSGSCDDGSITVKKGVEDVTLVLDGLDLTNEGTATTATAPLACNKSSEVTILAAAGTTNTLTDSAYNNDETYTGNENAENAVLKCKDGSQVIIDGSGTLNIVAKGKNGIKSGTTDSETDAANPQDAYLTIKNVTLNVTASVQDAVNAEQELNILSGTLSISAEDDALHSDGELNIGTAGSNGPTINITKAYEGIEGADINIYSGDIDILSSDDCINAANSDLKGASFSLTISGGDIYAYTTSGDGFDSNGTLTISGGNVEVWSANRADNQPLDSDGTMTISGGTVFSAGGSSGMGIKISNSQTYVTFGGSGGNSGGRGSGGQMQSGGKASRTQPSGEPQQSQPSGQPGQTQPSGEPSQTQPGGEPKQMPPGGQQGLTQPNGQPDQMQPDRQQMNGGQSGQTQPPEKPEEATQNQTTQTTQTTTDTAAVGNVTAASISKGSTVQVTDASGTALYTATAPCAASYVFFSSPSLSSSGSYSLKTGSDSSGVSGTIGASTSGSTSSDKNNSGQSTGGTTTTGTGDSGQSSDSSEDSSSGKSSTGKNENSTGSFRDIKNTDWFYSGVQYAFNHNLMVGTDAENFSPNAMITREQLWMILSRLSGASPATMADARSWAMNNNISDGSNATGTLTREEFATTLYRYAEKEGRDTTVSDTAATTLSGYSDSDSISSYAGDAFAWANSSGLINGDDNGLLNPKGTASRAQVAVILMRFCGDAAQ